MKKFWKFKYARDRRNGRKGIVFYGKEIDHTTPMNVINGFLGKPALELAGVGIMIHLFLPESKLEVWQKLALLRKAWGKDHNPKKGMAETSIDLEFLKSQTK